MIGNETLWNKLIIDDNPPSLESEFHNLFLSVKHSPQHISSFNSKIFLSALLSDKTLPVAVLKILSNVWLRHHGFTKTLSLNMSDYLRTVQDFQLESYFELELMTLPDLSYTCIIERVVTCVTADLKFLKIFPCVFKVDIIKCKIGKSWGKIMSKNWGHLTKNIHLVSVDAIDTLVETAFEISYLVCFRGTGMILRCFSGKCEILNKIDLLNSSSMNHIPPSDGVLHELHEQSKLTCCVFENENDIFSLFQHLKPLYDAARLFLDTLTVHAMCSNSPKILIKVFSLAKYVVSDQLNRALYTTDHIKYLQDLLASISSAHTEFVILTPFYRSLNFDPQTASWDELICRVREGLSMSRTSFQKLMESFSLNQERLDDCCSLTHLLNPSEIALFIVKILSSSTHSVTVHNKIQAIGKIFSILQGSNAQSLSMFCKSLYNEQGLSVSELQQLPDQSRFAILGDCSNVTKTINQLGSKGSGKWKDNLYHSLMMNFILFPDRLLKNITGQAICNKALTLPVAIFLKDFLPFTLRPLSSVSKFFYTSLREEFDKLKTVKEVKLFDMFLSFLKPILSHQTIVKLIMLPYMKSSCHGKHHTTLTLLQFYFQREPFYNFSIFYEIVRIWASSELDLTSSEMLDDDGLLDAMAGKIEVYPKEADMMLKLITQGWGWKAGLRFASIVESPKIKLGKTLADLDLSSHVFLDSISFTDGTFIDDTGSKTNSLARCMLQLAKYSNKSPKIEIDSLKSNTFAHELFKEFTIMTIKSAREWKNICFFLGNILKQETFPVMIRCSQNSFSVMENSLESLISKLDAIELNAEEYIKNDAITFVVLTVASGKSDKTKWLGLLCEDETHFSSINQCFVLFSVLLNLTKLAVLETLLLSLIVDVKTNKLEKDSDILKAFSLLPDSLVATITSTSSVKSNSKIGA